MILSDLIFFLLSAILIPTAFYYGFHQKLKFREEEKISIFISETIIEGKNDEFHHRLEENVDERIKEIDVYAYDQQFPSFSSLFNTFGRECDLVILNKALLEKDVSLFVNLPEEYQSENDYQSKGYPVYDKGNDISYMKDCISYKEDSYYLFINKESIHFKTLLKKGISDAGYTVFENFLKYKDK